METTSAPHFSHNTELSGHLINTTHLDELYREIIIGKQKMGVIEIYQNAPDYKLIYDNNEGFTCVDDVARAVVYYCRSNSMEPSLDKLYKIEYLTKFLLHMNSGNGYFYNFLLSDYSINKTHINSEAKPNFWTWRAFWALTEMRMNQSPGMSVLIEETNHVLEDIVNNIHNLLNVKYELNEYDGIIIPNYIANIGADQSALMIIGLCNLYRIKPDPDKRRMIDMLCKGLMMTQFGDYYSFPYGAFLSWQNLWHAWGNYQSYALLYAGRTIKNDEFVESGSKEVKYFYPFLIRTNYLCQFRLIKGESRVEYTKRTQFPQIAYDIRPMVFASIEAFKLTGNEKYAILAANIALWLFGRNVAGKTMYDMKTGRCFDGIDAANRVNQNSGAESTIEALLILNEIEQVPIVKDIVLKYIHERDEK